jgi:hypothetical protein
MNYKRVLLELLALFTICFLVLNFVIVYQDNVIDKQRVVIKEMLQHCGGK